MGFYGGKILDKELDQKLLDYITVLEDTNKEGER
jgi:hypothetical protein